MTTNDFYEPRWKKQCPSCFTPLKGWHGSDGPCNSYLWRQHNASPVEQFTDSNIQVSMDKWIQVKLPKRFKLTTKCEGCKTSVEAEGLCVDGTWRHTFIRMPEIPFPCGEEYPLFRLNLNIEELAKKCGKDLEHYVEDGLGSHKAFYLKLNFGASIVFKQSEHLSNSIRFGENAHRGATTYVDAFDAVTFGYEKIYWEILHELNITKAVIEAEALDKDEWQKGAQKLFTDNWKYWASQ